MARIVPSIATTQQAFDYLNISASQAAALLPSGTTTLATFIQNLLDRAARLITAWLDYDYTTNQVQFLRMWGNGKNFIRMAAPIGTVTTFESWDPTADPPIITNEGTGNLTVLAIDQKTIIRNDKKFFDIGLMYYVVANQMLDPEEYNGWPIEIVNIQLEIVALTFRESNQGASSIGKAQFETNSAGRALNYKDMIPSWQLRLRPWRKFSI